MIRPEKKEITKPFEIGVVIFRAFETYHMTDF